METERAKEDLRLLPLKTRLMDGYYTEGHFVPPDKETAIVGVSFDDENIRVRLSDGRVVTTPLSWFPALEKARPEDRARCTVRPRSVHWEELDEDLPLEVFLDFYGWREPATEDR